MVPELSPAGSVKRLQKLIGARRLREVADPLGMSERTRTRA